MGQWYYRTYPTETGERFAALQTWHTKANSENIINFWHITPEHTYLFTIKPNKRFNRKAKWSEDLCRELLGELRSPKPDVFVVRYVVDDTVLFSDLQGKCFPKPPKAPQIPPELKEDLTKEERKQRREAAALAAQERKAKKLNRPQIEEAKCQEPAPYILYGTHQKNGKEYSWRLTPDKPKRQGIVPGDRVLVWTNKGFTQVWVTRIEEAGDREQPTARVKKKLAPGEKLRKKAQKKTT